MPTEQKFNSCLFGGFKKEDVIKYINELIFQHEEELEKIKFNRNDEIEKLNSDLEEKQKKVLECEKKIEELEKTIDENKKEFETKIKEKEDVINNKELDLKELKEKINKMNEEFFSIADSENLEKDSALEVKKAEFIAKEKVNQIINKGRLKILKEHKDQIEEYNKNKEILKKNAFKEATHILNTAADKVLKINLQAEEEVQKKFEKYKQKAENIIHSAKILADKIIKESVKIALENSSALNLKEFDVKKKFDIELLNKELDLKVLNAMENLKCLNLFGEKNKKESEDGFFKKHRKINFEIFRRKNKKNDENEYSLN